MTTTSIDAVVYPQDEGTGVTDGTESFNSAALTAALARSTGAAWHDLTLGGLDTTAETVDVGPGLAFVEDPSVQGQSASASPSAPDTTLPEGIQYLVAIEETQTVDLQADTSGQLHLVVDPTASDTAQVVHGSAPSEPSLVIGSADSSPGGAATRSNVGPRLPGDLDAGGNDIRDVDDVNADTVTAGGLVDRSSGTTRDVDDISPDVSVSLSGSAPDATTYAIGTVIRDSDNPGSLWYVYDDSVSGGVRRLDPGTGNNPNAASYAKRFGTEIYANYQDGADLSTKITNSLSALPGGRGRIKVTPPEDGGAWTWGADLTIDPEAYNGIELDIAEGTRIEYGGTGWPLTVERGADNGPNSMTGGATFSVFGGDWHATGSDPSGWLKLVDTYRVDVCPRNIVGFENSTQDGTAVRIENVDRFSESTRIALRASSIDIGIDFAPPSVTGGSGTPSFQDTYITWTNLDDVGEYGIRWRGNFVNVTVDSCTIILGKDGSTGHYLDGTFKGVTFASPEVEHIGAQVSADPNTAAWETGPSYNVPPLILGGSFDNVDDAVVRANGADDVPRIAAEQDLFVIEDIGKRGMEFEFSSGSLITRDENGTIVNDVDGGGIVRSGYDTFATGSDVRFTDGVDFDLQALRDPPNNTTADSMTADPETATEDGYIEFTISGMTYQVPIYQS